MTATDPQRPFGIRSDLSTLTDLCFIKPPNLGDILWVVFVTERLLFVVHHL